MRFLDGTVHKGQRSFIVAFLAGGKSVVAVVQNEREAVVGSVPPIVSAPVVIAVNCDKGNAIVIQSPEYGHEFVHVGICVAIDVPEAKNKFRPVIDAQSFNRFEIKICVVFKIDDLIDELDLNLNIDDINHDTVSGFILELLGEIPEDNQERSVTINNLIFKITGIKANRVTKIKLTIKEEPEANLED